MFIEVCKSKIHRAKVTDKSLDYEGSITIDSDLMIAADILPNEKVQIVNVNNGQRFDTYVIKGAAGTGEICINGAAARLAEVNDIVIIISYAMLDRKNAESFCPKIVKVDSFNKRI